MKSLITLLLLVTAGATANADVFNCEKRVCNRLYNPTICFTDDLRVHGSNLCEALNKMAEVLCEDSQLDQIEVEPGDIKCIQKMNRPNPFPTVTQ